MQRLPSSRVRDFARHHESWLFSPRDLRSRPRGQSLQSSHRPIQACLLLSIERGELPRWKLVNSLGVKVGMENLHSTMQYAPVCLSGEQEHQIPTKSATSVHSHLEPQRATAHAQTLGQQSSQSHTRRLYRARNSSLHPKGCWARVVAGVVALRRCECDQHVLRLGNECRREHLQCRRERRRGVLRMGAGRLRWCSLLQQSMTKAPLHRRVHGPYLTVR